jgi:hypothetical protein
VHSLQYDFRKPLGRSHHARRMHGLVGRDQYERFDARLDRRLAVCQVANTLCTYPRGCSPRRSTRAYRRRRDKPSSLQGPHDLGNALAMASAAQKRHDLDLGTAAYAIASSSRLMSYSASSDSSNSTSCDGSCRTICRHSSDPMDPRPGHHHALAANVLSEQR